jgi:hypothetical protein
MVGPGALPHIAKSLQALRWPPADRVSYEAAVGDIEATYDRISALLLCQRELLTKWRVDLGEPAWVSFHEVLDGTKVKFTKRDRTWFRRRAELGVLADPTVITDVLDAAYTFLSRWGDGTDARCRYSFGESRLVVELRTTRAGTDAPVSDLVGSCMPSPACLAECQVEPSDWAALAWPALRLRSIGGTMTLRARGTKAKDRREYIMELRVPGDEIPFWKL